MSRALQIRFATTSSIHRVRNFAEELTLAFRREQKLGSLQMEDADAAADRILVSHVPAARLTRSIRLVSELLSSHRLTDEAEVVVVAPR